MNGNNIVADTSLLINFFNGREPARKIIQGQQIWISVITEMELLSFPTLKINEIKLINSFLKDCIILDLTKPIKQVAINLRRNRKLKLPDSIIAATSIHLGFPLVTMDRDFNRVSKLNTVVIDLDL